MANLKSGWKTLDKTPAMPEKNCRSISSAGNPNPADQREKLIKPEGPGGYYYSEPREDCRPKSPRTSRHALQGYADARSEGNVIYSYKKAETFAENLKSDAWKGPASARSSPRPSRMSTRPTDECAERASPAFRR